MPACRIFPLPPSKSLSDHLMPCWQQRGLLARALLPIGWLFFALVWLRRLAYQRGWLRSARLAVPVVVIGNLVAGGAGKTPLTLWLAQHLRSLGRNPGIVSRGYGRTDETIQKVGAGRTVSEVGDEPLLLAQRSGCPVFVGVDRGAAAAALLRDHPECDVILCDDGLQHLRLARDVEIIVMDRRGLMNGWPLPAGPLREPGERVSRVDALVLHDNPQVQVDGVSTFRMQLAGSCFYRLNSPNEHLLPAALQGLHLAAFAGIGEPQRFFDHLTTLGLSFEHHAFPDHHRYTRADFSFPADALLTTEKDALKCRGLTDVPIWVLPVEAVVEPDLARFVLEKIDGCTPA
jgi:tetraacyldisaccharide 4'-kinase